MLWTSGNPRTLVVVVGGPCSSSETNPSAAAADATRSATGAAAAGAGVGVTPKGGKLASGEGGGCCGGCSVESWSAAVVNEVVCGHEAEEGREKEVSIEK